MRQLSPEMSAKVMAAARLFAEHGLDDTTMSDIVAATGIPRATLYYYFDGKEAVFSYVGTVALDAFEDAVSAARDRPGSAAERLSAVIRAHLEVYAANPVAHHAVHLDLGRAARRADIVERIARAYLRPVGKLLEEGAADGSLRKVTNPETVAAAILGATTLSAERARFAPAHPRVISEVHQGIVSLIFQGLRPEPTRKRR
jgi:AcrR family transcriptional regulator